MTHFYLHEGRRYYPGRPFTYREINYTWQGATDELFESFGFTRVECDPRPSDRFAVVSGPDDQGKYLVIPHDLEECKAREVASTRNGANGLLSGTDWQVIRSAEDPTRPVEPAVAQYRADVRAACNAREAQVYACTTLEELASLPGPVWPEEPT